MKIGGEIASKDNVYNKSFAAPTNVTLTAEAEDGYEFEYYDLNGTQVYQPAYNLTVDCAINVDARFTSLTPQSSNDGGGGCFVTSMTR